MCGRFTLTTPASKLVEFFALLEPAGPLEPRYNAAPTQLIACIREADGFRSLSAMRWGLVPSWAKTAGEGVKMINARSETAATKPAFKRAFAARRCLVPADGFFEWKKQGTGKQPYLIRMKSGEPFAFAGIWERWRDVENDTDVESVAILTTTPNSVVADIHDRMPVIVPEDAHAVWLDRQNDSDRLQSVMGPYPAVEMEAVPVHKSVGNVRNDTPLCISPIETHIQRELF